MEKFEYQAGEEDQGAVGLVLEKAFERVSLPVVWALGNAFQFPQEDFAGAVRVPRAPEGGSVAEPLQTITAILQGWKWSCLLFRIVLQDALSEVTKIYPLLRLMVFVDDITALLKGKNEELVELAEKVLGKVEERSRGDGFEAVDH